MALFNYHDPRSGQHSETLLVCCHQGGSGASTFANWPDTFNGIFDVAAIQLPGREERMDEPFERDVRAIAQSASEIIAASNYEHIILFGYCMGALVAYEMALNLGADVMCLIVAASAEPVYAIEKGLNKSLSEQALAEAYANLFEKRFGISIDPEYAQMMMPILLADRDFSYHYRPNAQQQVHVPIDVYGGQNDQGIDEGAFTAWQSRTTAQCTFSYFEGGHMFMDEHEAAVMEKIKVYGSTHCETEN